MAMTSKRTFMSGEDVLPALEQSARSLDPSMATSIDESTFVRSKEKVRVAYAEELEAEEDDEIDTYDGLEDDYDDGFDDASTIATTFTCLQHQYQQQKQVKLEGILEKLGVSPDADDDERTRAWEKLTKEELLELLAALRVDLGDGAAAASPPPAPAPTPTPTKSSNGKPRTQTHHKEKFIVPVPPWRAIKEEDEETPSVSCRSREHSRSKRSTSVHSSNEIHMEGHGDAHSVKLPPWAAAPQSTAKPSPATATATSSRRSLVSHTMPISSNSNSKLSLMSNSSKRSKSNHSKSSCSLVKSPPAANVGPETARWFAEASSLEEQYRKQKQKQTTPPADDHFSVKLPPWHKTSKPITASSHSVPPPLVPMSPESSASSKPPSLTPNTNTVQSTPQPQQQPRKEAQSSEPVRRRTVSFPTGADPLPPKTTTASAATTTTTESTIITTSTSTAPPPTTAVARRPSLEKKKKMPSFRNLFGRLGSSSNSSKPKFEIPAVPENIQDILHAAPSSREGSFLQMDSSDTSARLAMINANWNSHYLKNRRPMNSASESNLSPSPNQRHHHHRRQHSSELTSGTTYASLIPNSQNDHHNHASLDLSHNTTISDTQKPSRSSTIQSNNNTNLRDISARSNTSRAYTIRSASSRSTSADC